MKSTFADVRRHPREREAQFIPEILLVRKLKEYDEETKSPVKLTENAVKESLTKILSFTNSEIDGKILERINRLRHPEDMDSDVLVVAAYLKITYPNGTTDSRSQGTEGYLTPIVLNSEFVNNLCHDILGATPASPEKLLKLKADILSYYELFDQ